VHFHPNRLKQSLPNTEGDQFIWACSSSDISFAKHEWVERVLERIRELPHKTFFFQSKDPSCFEDYDFPENVILGITLETNRDKDYEKISKATIPSIRYWTFYCKKHKRKRLTVEPIQEFDMDESVEWVEILKPEIVYVGYDTKKSKLPEPPLSKTLEFINRISEFTTVKPKLLRERWNGSQQQLSQFAPVTMANRIIF